jgi:AraC-like DNA-binding protein
MAVRRTPGGWEVIHGRGWPIHETIELGIVSALDARRFFHFAPDVELKSDMWILDYHFTDVIRFNPNEMGFRRRKSGVWHLYPPNVMFRLDTRRSRLPLHALWIRFHGAEKLGLERLVDNPLRMAQILDPEGFLMEKMRGLTLLADAGGNENYPQAMVGLIEIIQRLLQGQKEKTGVYSLTISGKFQKQDPLVLQTQQYLVAHLHERITLGRIAKELHTSIPTLKRRYSAREKESITQTLIRMRIGRVKQLLHEGVTVAEAAEKTGFFDPFHLSRTFRRLEGIPPREFLERMKSASKSR